MITTKTKRVLQSEVYNYKRFPIENGQAFYTDEGLFYQDLNGIRVLKGEFVAIEEEIIFTEEQKEALRGKIVAQKKQGEEDEYFIYYVDSKGNVFMLSGGGGSPGTILHEDLQGIQTLVEGDDYHISYNGAIIIQDLEFGSLPREVSTEHLKAKKISNRDISSDPNDPEGSIEFVEPDSGETQYKIKINGLLDAHLDAGGW